ncbi:M48 family metallopeptidase [Helicobacter sp. 10-6591]|uniref:M48 family metallopeptidase n=1 Tax=Helicobacter sp. 10-6591 TaxID=2004998 RepID=UPI000DCDF6F6|nr:M48 family metallopeptidase [Helicobacter sp. 10-6591]RAX55649.1 peptidase M48 [Helicobacter sp. 10-6591]
MLLVILFLLGFILPSIILDLLQRAHIKKTLKQKPILLDDKDYAKAGYYALEKLSLHIIHSVVDGVVFGFWIVYGLSALDSQLAGLNPYLHGIVLILSILLLGSLIGIPFSLYETFSIDKRYGFCKQGIGLFLLDLSKGLLFVILLGSAIIFGLLWLMNHYAYWWITCFCLIFSIVILANAIYPTIIAPLFNKFSPLKDAELTSRIESLLTQAGFKSNGVYVMDASKRDGRLNAYFGGIGKTKRVVLFDTLLDKISTDGLLAILGHELGHFKNNDILKSICLRGVFLFALFFIASHFPSAFFTQSNIPETNAAILGMLLLLAPVFSFWFLPVIGYFSRKAEYGADRFGAQLSSKSHLANALVRLVNENKTFPSSHPIYIFFYYSHPPLIERLKALDYEID